MTTLLTKYDSRKYLSVVCGYMKGTVYSVVVLKRANRLEFWKSNMEQVSFKSMSFFGYNRPFMLQK